MSEELEPAIAQSVVEQIAASEANRLKTHCPQGHPYDDENTFRSPAGRSCRTCRRAANTRYRERQRLDTPLPAAEKKCCKIEGCSTPAKSRGMCKLHYSQEWRKARPTRAREYRQENAEAITAYNREWDKRNSDKRASISRRYRKRHPEKMRAIWRTSGKRKYYRDIEHTRLHKRLQALGRRALNSKPDAFQYAPILLLDPCSYCGGTAGEVDHIVPLATGGSNEAANLTSACRSCNAQKGSRSVLAFLAERQAA